MSRWRLPVFALVLFAAAACGGSGGSTDPTETASPEPTATRSAAPTSSPTPAPPTVPPATLIVRSGTLIDGTGAASVANAYVMIEGERITAVGSGEPPSVAGARVVDARGGTIMPGMSDSHVHIARDAGVSEADTQPWLEGGITHLRDVATPPGAFPAVRTVVDELTAAHKAPRVFWAGPMVTAPAGYPFSVPRYADVGQAALGTDEARAIVNRLADGGARQVKLGLERGFYADLGWPVLSLEEVQAITETAHARGLLVTAHVTSLDEVRLALDGGVDGLAHTPLEPMPDELIAEMLAKGTTMATTASVWGNAAARPQAAVNAKRYLDAGGVVALATDFGCCGQAAGLPTLVAEMEFLRSAGGFTPMELIVAATRNGLITSGLGGEAGTIEKGKLADIIIVAADPLLDIQALNSVTAVIQGGAVVLER